MNVSVIVPFWRDKFYLRDCQDSIAAQSFEGIEVFVEEDDREHPLGVAAMRNRGLDAARRAIENRHGAPAEEYVLFVDIDDFPDDGAIDKAVETARDNPGAIVRLPVIKTFYKRETTLAGISRENEKTGDGSAEAAVIGIRDRSGIDSCLGKLIPWKLIGDTRFDESLRYYSDLPFMAAMLAGASQVEAEGAYYYKRLRNDPVRFPALGQESSNDRVKELDLAFREAAEGIEGKAYRDYAAAALRTYIEAYAVNAFMNGKDPAALSAPREDAARIAGLVGLAHRMAGQSAFAGSCTGAQETHSEEGRDISENVRTSWSRKEQKLLKLLAAGRTFAALRFATEKRFFRLKKGPFGNADQWKLMLYRKLFLKLPVNKRLIVFESFSGHSYCDSCRAVYEYMTAERPEYKYVWFLQKNVNVDIPGKHRVVRELSLKYFYMLARAGAIVDNGRPPKWFIKRDGSIFLQTWHGTPLKKLVFDLDDVHSPSPDYKEIFYRQARQWDSLVSDNAFSTEVMEHAFLFPRERILETGYPRNDILYAPDRESRAAAIRKKLGIPADKKVVLYAPTWRDDEYYSVSSFRFELPIDTAMMKSLKDEYFFILRMHYLVDDRLKLKPEDRDFVADMSGYNDIGELYLISDVLVTDYSSTFFDYANLGRPILFYVYDFEKYRDTLRGFYFDMETGCPGPLLYTQEELKNALCNLDSVAEEYKEKYDSFRREYCSLGDGHAAERVVKAVFGE